MKYKIKVIIKQYCFEDFGVDLAECDESSDPFLYFECWWIDDEEMATIKMNNIIQRLKDMKNDPSIINATPELNFEIDNSLVEAPKKMN